MHGALVQWVPYLYRTDYTAEKELIIKIDVNQLFQSIIRHNSHCSKCLTRFVVELFFLQGWNFILLNINVAVIHSLICS